MPTNSQPFLFPPLASCNILTAPRHRRYHRHSDTSPERERGGENVQFFCSFAITICCPSPGQPSRVQCNINIVRLHHHHHHQLNRCTIRLKDVSPKQGGGHSRVLLRKLWCFGMLRWQLYCIHNSSLFISICAEIRKQSKHRQHHLFNFTLYTLCF